MKQRVWVVCEAWAGTEDMNPVDSVWSTESDAIRRAESCNGWVNEKELDPD